MSQSQHAYQLEPAGLTDIGHVRPTNEDSLIAEGDLFAVADGMGGLGRGEVASRLALDRLRDVFDTDPTADGLVEAVREANRAVHEQATAEPPLTDDGADDGTANGAGKARAMGTTIAAVARVGDPDNPDGPGRLAVVNVGDSRVYLLRDGRLTRLSHDHSKVAELVRQGELTDDEAWDHPERHILTRALGVEPEVEPAVSSTEPAPGDRLLLCSDGLHNELSATELAELLAAADDPDTAANRLVERAKEAGGNDNVTAIVLDVR